MASDTRDVVPDLTTLVTLFYPVVEQLGEFREMEAGELPAPFGELLAHSDHMTVTVERHHRSPVDVQVIDKNIDGDRYARKILLTRQSDGAVVQYGIMRINVRYLSDAVRREIQSEAIPLGRVLINHNVLRKVELISLWEVTPTDELRDLLAMPPGATTFGRTALIHVDGEPAVELLEIVTTG